MIGNGLLDQAIFEGRQRIKLNREIVRPHPSSIELPYLADEAAMNDKINPPCDANHC